MIFLKQCGLKQSEFAEFRTALITRNAAMIDSTGDRENAGLSEDNCRIGQLSEGFLDNIQLDGHHQDCGGEAAKFAELIVLNELIFGSANHAIQELVETRSLHKSRLEQTG